MIDLVLNKDFVLAQARAVLQELEGPSRTKTVAHAGEGKGEVDEVASALAAAILEESKTPAVAAAEQKAYIPTNCVLGVLQTVLEEFMEKEQPRHLRPAPGFSEPGGPAATHVFVDPEALSFGDIKWVKGIGKALVSRLLHKRHDFVRSDPPPTFTLAADARIILVGDWGLDNESARKVGTLIRAELESAHNRQAHLIHLGDVYYSGETWEAQRRFLDPWPVRPGEENRWCSWALNGNHDMYSGGHGYFETILGDNRFRRQRAPDGRGVSYFRLHNDSWQFLGLDTAWDAHLLTHGGLDGFLLNPPQADWVLACLQQAPALRTVLLTHHQFLSTHNQLHGDLAAKLRPALDGGGFDAWFWGHEHICEKFRRRTNLRYAACAGHGAMPQSGGDARPESGGWEYDEWHEDADLDRWRYCGYAVIDLNGSRATVRYVDELDRTHHRFTL